MSFEPRGHPRGTGRLEIVELIGTPGAGKTTLSTEIIELLQEGGWVASTIVGAAREHARRTVAGRLLVRHTSGRVQQLLLWWLFYVLASMHAFVFLFEERQLSRTVLGTQLRRPIRVARRVQICFWFFQLAGRQRFLRATAREREVLVVDDGFLHRAVHIYASHVEDPSPRAVGHYVDLLSEPSLVVSVRCDEEICEARVRMRGVWRHSRRLTVGELSRYLTRSDIVVDIAGRRARERGWRITSVDNDDEVLGAARAALAPVLVAAFPPMTPGSVAPRSEAQG
jgi:broad-specificity NMP kinase